MPSMCRCCRTPTSTEREFLRACASAGMLLINGRLYGALTDGDTPVRYRELDASRGFQCPTCHLIYCQACLRRFAPAHASGGSACPVCGTKFEPLT
jgi:hypothetical protein